MTSPLPLEAVVIDLDGVVRFFPPDDEAVACRAAGLAPGTVLTTAFRPGLLSPALTGRTTDAAWRAEVSRTLAAEHGLPPNVADTVVADWSRSPGEVEPAALRAVADARDAGLTVVLLANATTRLDADLDALGLEDAFDAVVSSARTGVAKPSPEAFRRAVQAAERFTGRLHPAQVLVVDDSVQNVAAARALGHRAYHAVTRGLLPLV